MPPPMGDFTYALDENGFVLNDDFSGILPFVDVTNITGLDSAPLRLNTTENEGQDGTYVDAEFESMRTIVITATIYDGNNQAQILLNALKAAYSSSTIRPFYFKHPGQSLQFINCQGGGLQYPVDTNWRLGQCNIQASLLASDPYIYDYPANFDSALFAATTGIGIGFNRGFNTGFGGNIFPPVCTVTNSGNHTAYPIITLTGPLTNPVLSDALSDVQMRFNLTLTASDSLVIDCRKKTVVLDAQQSRRSALQGLQWLSVPPQTTDSIYLEADTGTGSFNVLLYNTYY